MPRCFSPSVTLRWCLAPGICTALRESHGRNAGLQADGEVPLRHVITSGETRRAEPHPKVMGEYPNMMASHTANHWANDSTQKEWMKRVNQHVVAMRKKDGMEDAAARVAPWLMMLDCWPVNLTAQFRQWVKDNCPGCRLIFIPAGGTGRFQVNDTDCHQPLKAMYRRLAHAWHTRKIMQYKRERVRKGVPVQVPLAYEYESTA